MPDRYASEPIKSYIDPRIEIYAPTDGKPYYRIRGYDAYDNRVVDTTGGRRSNRHNRRPPASRARCGAASGTAHATRDGCSSTLRLLAGWSRRTTARARASPGRADTRRTWRPSGGCELPRTSLDEPPPTSSPTSSYGSGSSTRLSRRGRLRGLQRLEPLVRPWRRHLAGRRSSGVIRERRRLRTRHVGTPHGREPASRRGRASVAVPHAGPRQLLGWSPRRSRPPRMGLISNGILI